MAQRQARILVADDDERFVYFVATMLERAGYEVVATTSADAAVLAAREEPPDAAIVDVVMPGRGGYSVCRELREEIDPDLPVVLVSGERADPMDRAAGIMVGGDDYLVKPLHPEELLARLQRLLERARGRSPESTIGLTDREVQILQLIAEGWPPSEIAERLFIAPKTVSSHIQRIFTKLAVHTRAQAVALAYEAGLIRVDASSPRGAQDVEAHVVQLLGAA